MCPLNPWWQWQPCQPLTYPKGSFLPVTKGWHAFTSRQLCHCMSCLWNSRGLIGFLHFIPPLSLFSPSCSACTGMLGWFIGSTCHAPMISLVEVVQPHTYGVLSRAHLIFCKYRLTENFSNLHIGSFLLGNSFSGYFSPLTFYYKQSGECKPCLQHVS